MLLGSSMVGKKEMIRKRNGEIEWLEFELLAGYPELKHGVFLRNAEGIFPREKMGETIGLAKLASGRQVHGSEVLCVEKEGDLATECDGIMTTQKGLGLVIGHADCQAALFYDPKNRAIANVHCGWRGNVQNIYQKTVLNLKAAFGSEPSDLLVCISPSLGPKHAEFKNWEKELPEAFWGFQTEDHYFDLWEISRAQLEAEGVTPSHIQVASICTYAHPEDFFSYRRDKKRSPNNATIVGLL